MPSLIHCLPATCTLCKQTYIGQTTRRLHDRAREHITAVKCKNRTFTLEGTLYRKASGQQSRHQFCHPNALQGRFTPAYRRGPKSSRTSTRYEQKKRNTLVPALYLSTISRTRPIPHTHLTLKFNTYSHTYIPSTSTCTYTSHGYGRCSVELKMVLNTETYSDLCSFSSITLSVYKIC